MAAQKTGQRLLQLVKVVNRSVSRIDAAVEVSAQPDVLRAARRAREVDCVPDHVVQSCPAPLAQMGRIKADAEDAAATGDLGRCRIGDLPIARKDGAGVAVRAD